MYTQTVITTTTGVTQYINGVPLHTTASTTSAVTVETPTIGQNEITATCVEAAGIGAVFSGTMGMVVVAEVAGAGWITGTAAIVGIATAGIGIPFFLIAIAAVYAVYDPNAAC